MIGQIKCCPGMTKSALFNFDERDGKLRIGMDEVKFCPYCGVEIAGELAEDGLSIQEKAIIQEFAFSPRPGDLREIALEVHARFLRRARDRRGEPLLKGAWPVEASFMSEMDNPCPDLTLRGHYRELVIENWNRAGRPMALFPGKFYAVAETTAKPAKAKKAARKSRR